MSNMELSRSRRRQHARPQKRRPINDALYQELSAIPQTWRNYLRQSPSNRFTVEELHQAAQIMEKGGDCKARFCAGMAYAEIAMRSSGYACKEHTPKALGLLSSARNQTEKLPDFLNYTHRINCLDLYEIPAIAGFLSDQDVLSVIKKVSASLDFQINAINQTLDSRSVRSEEDFTHLIGAASEFSVLRVLQSEELFAKGYLAVPSFPWEENSIDDVFVPSYKINLLHKKRKINRNYDISIINIENPTEIVPLQVKTSPKNYKVYEDSIAVIYTDEVVSDILNESVDGLTARQRINRYIFPENQAKRAKRLERVASHIIEILDLPNLARVS